MRRLASAVIIVLCFSFGLLLFGVMLDLPAAPVNLAEQVAVKLGNSGVTHPVTAVLLNFRGYDTMLEVTVLFVALSAMLTQSKGRNVQRVAAELHPAPAQLQVLRWLVRVVVPLTVLMAGYLFWVGAYRAGGAFQAAVVLAAAGVLLRLTGMLRVKMLSGPLSRVGLLAGLLFFFAVAAVGTAHTAAGQQGSLLQYPPGWAGALILSIEAGLTFSLGLILTRAFLALADEGDANRAEE